MASTVEQVKARLNIVDVVSSYLTLEKAGANYRARCPFHTEKTPSFYVSPTREAYYCFGCNRGGDIFTFVEEIEGLDFLGALKVLALRAGVPLEPVNRKTAGAKERLYAVVEAAANYFNANLMKTPKALAYLAARGLDAGTVIAFRLGLAPAGWRELTDHLLLSGFTEPDLGHSGLVARSNRGDQIFDRFRNRIMFPIADAAGRMIAFSGRLFEAEAKLSEAKYINSPDTLLYDKSRVLYLFDRAKLAMRRADRCILVEGQFDAVLSHQAGITETVAVSGTALSGDHLDLIRRLTKKIIMAFDADAAGVKASNRAITMALERGFEVRVAVLPDDRDPADVIRESKAIWEKALTQTLHVIDFLIETIKRRGLERRETAHRIEGEVYPYLAALANPIDRAYFIGNIAELVNLPETAIREGVARTKNLEAAVSSEKITSANQSPPATPTRRNRLEELIFGFAVWQENADGTTRALIAEYWGDELFACRQHDFQDRKSELALLAEITYGQAADLKTILRNLLDEWQKENWREELAATVHRIKALGSNAEPKLVNRYLERCQELSRQISNKL